MTDFKSAGRHTSWTSKAPGAVDLSKDTKDHKNHNRELMQELVQGNAAFWSAIQDKNITRNIFTITADNTASNYGMMGGLQKKFSAMGVKWPKSERFHQGSCHVLKLMAKDFLEHLGEFTDSDYIFFDRYISTRAAELEDKMIEGCNSFAKDFVVQSTRHFLNMMFLETTLVN
ncbi:hypothetical protein PPACK8108_LOCUS9623 [Phakopsora pachyrhizi]|uniref:DUF659 domain-containing protein n=1 Tax=Phakopsora pachyrhizi TaxID=170000 RepID=A0AAV0AZJ1_PHAPC|nr:hypothetical protein PPACK8108_LOCUS9623 [Phakopsora pachyrhizi]